MTSIPTSYADFPELDVMRLLRCKRHTGMTPPLQNSVAGGRRGGVVDEQVGVQPS
jgi:hypothetical protein